LPKAIEILDNRPDISIVYTDSMLFGEGKGVRVAGDFNLQRLMLGNFIDTCAVFRRSMIEQIGPYDTFHPLMEDWELWLRAAFNGYRFHYIPEPLFYYRILPNEKGSTNRSHAINNSKIKGDLNTEHIRERHSSYFGPQYVDAYFTDKFRASPLGMLTKLILKLYFPKRFARMVAKGKLRKYL
jgi:GT2 family glycosyltransferase